MNFAFYIIIFVVGIFFAELCIRVINNIQPKDKLKNKYFIIELLIGFISVGICVSLNLSLENMSTNNLIEYLYEMIFIMTLLVLAGIDKKNKKIYRPIIFIGSIIGFIHIIFLYMIENIGITSIYKYIIYFIIICALSEIATKHSFFKYSYLIQIMMVCIYINMFVSSEIFMITALLTMILLVINVIYQKRKSKIDKSNVLTNIDIPIAMYLCISNILAMLLYGIIMQI